MSILVAYASKHGATVEIAKRITESLWAGGRARQGSTCPGGPRSGLLRAVCHRQRLLDALVARRDGVREAQPGPLGDDKGADGLGVKGKKALNVMKVQRNAARDELRAFNALGLSPEQITALTKKLEGGPHVDAIRATPTRDANTPAGFRHVACAGALLHISDSWLAKR